MNLLILYIFKHHRYDVANNFNNNNFIIKNKLSVFYFQIAPVRFIILPVSFFTPLSLSVSRKSISLTGPAYSQHFDMPSNTAASISNILTIPG